MIFDDDDAGRNVAVIWMVALVLSSSASVQVCRAKKKIHGWRGVSRIDSMELLSRHIF